MSNKLDVNPFQVIENEFRIEELWKKHYGNKLPFTDQIVQAALNADVSFITLQECRRIYKTHLRNLMDIGKIQTMIASKQGGSKSSLY